jgi:hypothetical protein
MPSLRRLLPVLLLVVCGHLALFDALHGLGRIDRPAVPPDRAPPVLMAELLPPAPATVATEPVPEPGPAPAQRAAAAPQSARPRPVAPRRIAPARTPAAPAPAAPAPEPVPVADGGPVSAPVPVASEDDSAPADAAAVSGTDRTVPGPPVATADGPPAPPQAEPVPAVAAPAGPVRLPGPMELRYAVTGHVKGFDYQAHATLQWRHDGARYDARFELGAFLLGKRVQTSSGAVGPAGLEPMRFADRARSERAAHFDYAARRITFSANTPEAALQPGAQDRLSVILQLAALLGGDPARYPEGSTLTVQTASARNAEPWTFLRAGTDDLALPGGPVPAVRLLRAPRRDFDDTVEVWLAPSLGWLPVRLRFTQAGGDAVDQILQDRMPLP